MFSRAVCYNYQDWFYLSNFFEVMLLFYASGQQILIAPRATKLGCLKIISIVHHNSSAAPYVRRVKSTSWPSIPEISDESKLWRLTPSWAYIQVPLVKSYLLGPLKRHWERNNEQFESGDNEITMQQLMFLPGRRRQPYLLIGALFVYYIYATASCKNNKNTKNT